MPAIPTDDVHKDLTRRHDDLSSGQVSNSLLLQLLSDLGILNERLSAADRQRTDIIAKVEEVLREQNTIKLLNHRIEELTRRVSEIQTAERLNSEFRLKFMGGSIVGKLLWVILGGAVAIMAEKFWRGP